jgi:hypothetical protein
MSLSCLSKFVSRFSVSYTAISGHGTLNFTGRDWSPHPDLNRGPLPYQGSALPLSYVGNDPALRLRLERVMGIEPTSSAWKAEVLPLNYTRNSKKRLRSASQYLLNLQTLSLAGSSACCRTAVELHPQFLIESSFSLAIPALILTAHVFQTCKNPDSLLVSNRPDV